LWLDGGVQTASPGRHRDEELTERILEETARVLSEGGYSRLRIEQVAAAVECGKAAIYRRWGSRAELAVEALCRRISFGESLGSGDVVEDLVAHVWRNVRNQVEANADGGGLSMWAITADPEVRELFWERFGSVRRAMGLEILGEAVARGQLARDVDADAILDMLAGYVFYRGSVRNVAVTHADVRALVTAIVAAPPRRAGRRR
jgi:AcrR family transcriptional regulator